MSEFFGEREAAFDEYTKELESSKYEAKELLEDQELSDSDRLRFTRVLQLVERYRPEREIQPNRVRSVLESLYRALPSNPFKRKAEKGDPSARAYLLSQSAIEIRNRRCVSWIGTKPGCRFGELRDHLTSVPVGPHR